MVVGLPKACDGRGPRGRMTALTAMILVSGLAGPGAAETIVLKNGNFVEGKITRQTETSVRIKTCFGERSLQRKEIDQIVESGKEGGDETAGSFETLPAAEKTIRNAETLYDLKQFDRALERLEPLRDYQDDKTIRMRVDWLTIEIHERSERWDEARKLLVEKKSRGTPPEAKRAQAHLEIFDANAEYDLRYVGKRPAGEFIRSDEVRNRAKEPNSLREVNIMRLALEEYCDQLLAVDKTSVRAFGEKLQGQTTYDAVKKAPGSGDFAAALPYLKELYAAEEGLFKARAILGDYGAAYELDLIRTELVHLFGVGIRLVTELFAESPETFNPQSDPRSGRLTPQGQQEWRRRCEEFITKAQPVSRLIDYMIKRTEPYPLQLRDFRELLGDINQRLEETIKAVKQAKDRAYA